MPSEGGYVLRMVGKEVLLQGSLIPCSDNHFSYPNGVTELFGSTLVITLAEA
jgi:hypothetical protein